MTFILLPHTSICFKFACYYVVILVKSHIEVYIHRVQKGNCRDSIEEKVFVLSLCQPCRSYISYINHVLCCFFFLVSSYPMKIDQIVEIQLVKWMELKMKLYLKMRIVMKTKCHVISMT